MATVLLDFDKTLFNTPAWIKTRVYPQLCQTFSITNSDLDNLLEEYQRSLDKYTDFSHQTLFPFLEKKRGWRQSDLHKVFFDEKSTAESVFPDVRSTLGKLKGDHNLGIFSEADASWQQNKIINTGLLPFLSDHLIFIFRRKETADAIAQLPLPVTIVDDNKGVIEYLLRFEDITPVWINRNSKEQHEIATTIHMLSDLTDVL